MEVRPQVKSFFELSQEAPSISPAAEERISVSPATKRLASAYERFRNILEPDEIDILRRKAIARILARRVAANSPTVTGDDPLTVATALLQELIRGSYIEAASHTEAVRIAQRIDNIRRVEANLSSALSKRLLSIAAVSIDRIIFPKKSDETLIHLMYHDTYQRTTWIDNMVDDSDRPAQLFIGCHRALFAADDNEIIYHYFVHHFPVWEKNEPLTDQETNDLLRHLPTFFVDIYKLIDHPAHHRLTMLLRPVAVPYHILRQLSATGSATVTASKDTLATAVQSAVQERGRTIVQRVNARARHSVLFLLFTKTILVFLVEVPYERLFLREIHWGALAANTLFHPILLFFFSATVRLPGSENNEKIVEQVDKIVTGDGELPTVVIHKTRRYGPVTWAVFGVIYTILFIVIFWGLTLLLDRLGFSLLAMFFFVFYLGLVSFLAMRNRRTVDSLRVIPKYEGAFTTILSFLFLPILELGGWLARTIQRFNIPLFLMDRILEAPFKLLIDIAEEWFIFVRERREEIV